MKRRGGRIIRKLLLPVAVAALLAGIMGASAQRSWRADPAVSESSRGVEDSTVSVPTITRPTLSHAAPTAPREARPAMASTALVAERAIPHQPTARAIDREFHGQLLSRAFPQTFGPAPEPVAPSSEAAPHASEPPPAVVSAPRLAPAPSIYLALAPEPQAATDAAPLQFAAPAPRAAARSDSGARRAATTASAAISEAWAQGSVRSVRFDAGYYYGSGKSVQQLANDLTASWAQRGVNLVYYYAYNRVYGARYRTNYPGNIMEDYGRQDLLRYVLDAAHGRGIKVVAWFYGPQHKQMWETHSAWREKTASGRDYRSTSDSYYLCVRNPEVQNWWLGFIEDVLIGYPDLDGVDISEAQVDSWGDDACFCKACRAQYSQEYPRRRMSIDTWRQFRANGLTRLLTGTNHLVKSHGKQAHITTVFTARADGALMPASVVRDATGFDLDAILSSADRPDVIQAEVIWQQWAATYSDHVTFTPDWTHQAVLQAKNMVAGRSALTAHLEVTDFGAGGLSGPQIGTTVAAAVAGDPYGVDIYDAFMIDQTEGATSYLQTAWLNF